MRASTKRAPPLDPRRLHLQAAVLAAEVVPGHVDPDGRAQVPQPLRERQCAADEPPDPVGTVALWRSTYVVPMICRAGWPYQTMVSFTPP